MAHEFKLGDRVRLASGGMVMTVNAFVDDSIEVVYMEGTKAKYDTFKPHVLVKVTKPTFTEAFGIED